MWRVSKSFFSNFPRAVDNYKLYTPSFGRVQALYNNQLKSDHLALRTFKKTGGIDVIKKSLNEHYISGGELEIPEKHLHAEWFYTINDQLRQVSPKIFVSELDENKLSEQSQLIIEKYMTDKTAESLEHLVLDCCGNGCKHCGYILEPKKSNKISLKDYNKLAEESEYAAWTLIHGSQINHFAVCIPETDTFDTFLNNLTNNGFTLNTIGGTIKSSSDGMLHQASTMSDQFKYAFKEEKKDVPGFFVEFVQRDRYPNGSIREGFEANNALHIFDSTSKYTSFNV